MRPLILSLVLVDFALTFATPALAYTTPKAWEAIRISFGVIRRQWPASAMYIFLPPLAIQLVAQTNPQQFNPVVGFLFVAASTLLNLLLKGATAGFYMRHQGVGPELDVTLESREPHFAEAIKICLGKYVTFSGRAGRSEYWVFVLFVLLVTQTVSVLAVTLFGNGPVGSTPASGSWQTLAFSTIAMLAFVPPGLAVAVRRLHDLNRSGWWLLISLVPFVGPLVLLVWLCSRGTAMENRFG